MRKLNFILLTLLGITLSSFGQGFPNPSGAGYPSDVFYASHMIDVSTYANVDPTGATDSTAGIQQAISDLYGVSTDAPRQKTLYFPNGTYLISNTLDAVSGTNTVYRLVMIGQSKSGVTIKLQNNATGFGSPGSPKAMIKTESDGTIGYDGFDNGVWNMTLDSGTGNSGAVGIDYLANNTGAIRNVKIQTSGTSYAGIIMTRAYPGPCLIKDLEVDGFQTGVSIGQLEYSVTIEGLTLKNQTAVGLNNNGNAVAIRNMSSSNAVPAIINTAGASGTLTSMLVLLDSTAARTSGTVSAAINSASGLFVRNFTATGYTYSINSTVSGTGSLPGNQSPTVTEYSSHVALTPGFADERAASLGLQINETPVFVDTSTNSFSNWYSVGLNAPHDPTAGTDQSAALQAAIDTAAAQCKTTLYFPPGKYYTLKTLKIHGSIRRILGFGSYLMPFASAVTDPFGANNANNLQPILQVGALTGGTSDIAGTLEIDRLGIWASSAKQPVVIYYAIQHSSTNALVLRDMQINVMPKNNQFCYHGATGTGALYLEDVGGAGWFFDHPGQNIWARQFDPEGDPSTTTPLPKVVNGGCNLWILGLKTEGAGTLVSSTAGAMTEILGGSFYPVHSTASTANLLDVQDLATLGKLCNNRQWFHAGLSEPARGDKTWCPANTDKYGNLSAKNDLH